MDTEQPIVRVPISNTIYQGDVLEVLRTFPDECIHCVVTSPPYWSLRDYGIEGQLGLEATPEEYVSKMVEIFREVRRVLRSDGTLWLNLGDSYASSGVAGPVSGNSTLQNGNGINPKHKNFAFGRAATPEGLKPKDLIGIPWRVALALQADGWWLRSDIIWSKPNPMPESVTDRPTKSHEYVFLMTKSARYFYDGEAIRESNVREWDETNIGVNNRINTGVMEGKVLGRDKNPHCGLAKALPNPNGRNKRTVWTIATQAYSEAHFATFPEKLVEPCILAGTSTEGVCEICGAQYQRVIKQPDFSQQPRRQNCKAEGEMKSKGNGYLTSAGQKWQEWRNENSNVTLGFQLSCTCNASTQPAIVLDPFFGSGTTGVVAKKLGRSYIGIELNPEYIKLAEKRLNYTQPALFAA